VKAFRLGYCPAEGRGMMRGRLVIPVFDYRPEDRFSPLVAYVGRWVGPEETVPEGEDKYKLPKGFHKSLVVYNLHRVAGRRHLVVVEGYFSVFRLHQLHVPAVALMVGTHGGGTDSR
jgi:DNA primase